jgi:hypothetical protein
MGLLGEAVLAIWNDIAPGGDAEFVHWHTKEHIPERVGISGFLRGRRYEAVASEPRYFNLYETDSLGVLGGPAYVERLNNPTPWTRRALPLFRNTKRTACRVVKSLGQGVGGALATLDAGPAAGHEQGFRGWLIDTTLPALLDRPGIVGVHLCEADVGTTQVKTEEKKLRDRPDALARWVLMVEGVDAATVQAVCDDSLNPDLLERHGAALEAALAVYRLSYCLTK